MFFFQSFDFFFGLNEFLDSRRNKYCRVLCFFEEIDRQSLSISWDSYWLPIGAAQKPIQTDSKISAALEELKFLANQKGLLQALKPNCACSRHPFLGDLQLDPVGSCSPAGISEKIFEDLMFFYPSPHMFRNCKILGSIDILDANNSPKLCRCEHVG